MIELALAIQAESRLLLAHEVISITRNENETTIHTNKGNSPQNLWSFALDCKQIEWRKRRFNTKGEDCSISR